MNRNETTSRYDKETTSRYNWLLNNKLLIYMANIRQINIKNRTYYFFHDMINIENFDSNLPKIDKKNHIKILVFTALDWIYQN